MRFDKGQKIMLIVDALIFAFIIGMMIKDKPPKIEYRVIEINCFEDQEESKHIRDAVISTIGTDEEEECWGYDFTQVVEIIYKECGGDYVLAKKIATCVYNAQERSGWTLNPLDVCKEYKYTSRAGYYGSKTLNACIEVFLDGEVDSQVGKATMFYNPRYTVGTPSHESKTYVCSYNSDFGEIRFFEE